MNHDNMIYNIKILNCTNYQNIVKMNKHINKDFQASPMRILRLTQKLRTYFDRIYTLLSLQI